MNSEIITKDQQKYVDDNLSKLTSRELANATSLRIGIIHMYLQKINKKAVPIRVRSKTIMPSYEKNGLFDVIAYATNFII